MTKKDIDWEKDLKPKPFRNNSFTPQNMRRVEEKLDTRPKRMRVWRRAGLSVLAAALLAGIAGLGAGGALDALRQSPPAATTVAPRIDDSGASLDLDFPLKDGDGSGTVAVPLTLVEAELAIGDSENALPPAAPNLDFAMTEQEASSVQAVMAYTPDTGEGLLLLAPRSWTLETAQVGANGSQIVEYVNPEHPDERLSYTESAVDGGTISLIGTYFPSRADWAERKGFPPSADTDAKPRTLYSNENETSGFVRYDRTRPGDGVIASGAAYYEREGDVFRHEEIALSGKGSSAAADVALRFFEANDGAYRLSADSARVTDSRYADEKSWTVAQNAEIRTRLNKAGLKLAALTEADQAVYATAVNGVKPTEWVIDRENAAGTPAERLSVFVFGSREEAQRGAEAFGHDFDASLRNEQISDTAPHVLTGANELILYWSSSRQAEPFSRDQTVRDVLNDLDREAKAVGM